MKPFLSEKNIVVVLFVLVLITFALAQEDSKKMEKAYIGINASARSLLVSLPSSKPEKTPVERNEPSASRPSE
jgi:hypothetical protein